MENENVVQMPTLLDRLWGKLKTCMAQEVTNRNEWITIQETKCATLVEIRDQFIANIAFGQACKDNGFGEDVLGHETRAAAIEMGRDPVALSACLKVTTRNSLLTIYREEFSRFRSVSKTATKPTGTVKPKNNLQPKRRINTTPQAEAAARAVLDEGKTYTEAEATTGLSSTVLRSAIAREEGRREAAAEIKPTDLSLSAQQKLETAIRQHQKKLDLQFEERVRITVLSDTKDRLEWMKKQEDWANKIIASHKGVMPRETFRKIKACLHPDHNTFKYAAEALQAFSELEKVLVKPDEPVFSGPPLPTLAELNVLRAKRTAERKAQREAAKAARAAAQASP